MFKGHKMGRCSVQGSTPATERRLAVATWNQLGKYVICACLHLHHVWGTCRYIYIGRYKAHCSPTSGYVSCRTFLASTACWASRSHDKSISGSSSNGMIPALRIPVMADQCAQPRREVHRRGGNHPPWKWHPFFIAKGKKKRHIGRFGTMFNHFWLCNRMPLYREWPTLTN